MKCRYASMTTGSSKKRATASVYAVYLAIVGGLPIPHVIFAAGIVVITLFVVADMRSGETDSLVIPLRIPPLFYCVVLCRLHLQQQEPCRSRC